MKKIKTLNIIAIVLLAYQILSYVASLTSEKKIISGQANLLGYYFGFNLPIIISLVLFIIAFSLKKRMKQNKTDDMIDSIGKSE